MKPSHAVLTLSTLTLAFGWGTAARAEEPIGLSFDLQPAQATDPPGIDETVAIAPTPDPGEAALPAATTADAPLPVPPEAANPPFAGDSSRPAGVYGGADALALSETTPAQDLLPAPPTPPTSVAIAQASPVQSPPAASPPDPAPPLELEEPIDAVLLKFDPDRDAAVAAGLATPAPFQPISAPQPSVSKATAADTVTFLFQGGTDSLVARAVGSAEGTRTPEGHKTPAYFGHVDPGNRAWNLGTFSYQHDARTPEEADAKQLARLKSQTLALKQKAQAHGLELSVEELLNGIDLANQAPMAALDRGGYVEWLAEAHALGMTGSDAIVWARTRSFIDPDTQRWNAPGLGNNIYSISSDQTRRADAIARAVSLTPASVMQADAPGTGRPEVAAQPPEPSPEPSPEEAIALIFNDSFAQASQVVAETAQNVADTPLPLPSVDTTLPLEIPTQQPEQPQPEAGAPPDLQAAAPLSIVDPAHAPDRTADAPSNREAQPDPLVFERATADSAKLAGQSEAVDVIPAVAPPPEETAEAAALPPSDETSETSDRRSEPSADTTTASIQSERPSPATAFAEPTVLTPEPPAAIAPAQLKAGQSAGANPFSFPNAEDIGLKQLFDPASRKQ